MNGIVSKAYVHATIALHSGWGNVRSEISADLGYQKSSLAGARARASGPLGACQGLLASANTIRIRITTNLGYQKSRWMDGKHAWTVVGRVACL